MTGQKNEPTHNRQKPTLSRYEVIGLIIVVAIAALIAIPQLKGTYILAVLSGQCAHEPSPSECGGEFIPARGALRQYSTPGR
ncbi:MAG: hypothetical protein JO128_06430 [Alphaproteobacteria bacterium]|nr:hypothetical protein [Alphaproteobacteria bacterium]